MPKTKLGQKDGVPFWRVHSLIHGYMFRRGVNAVELAAACKGKDITYGVLTRRLREPENFTLRELSVIAKQLDIPVDELRSCIEKG